MSECCSFAPEEAKKEEYTVYTDELAKEVGVDPRPNETLVEIDEFNDWLFPHINNSHYRMAFCQSLEAYDEAYEDFMNHLTNWINVWKQTDFYSEITLPTAMYEHTSHWLAHFHRCPSLDDRSAVYYRVAQHSCSLQSLICQHFFWRFHLA